MIYVTFWGPLWSFQWASGVQSHKYKLHWAIGLNKQVACKKIIKLIQCVHKTSLIPTYLTIIISYLAPKPIFDTHLKAKWLYVPLSWLWGYCRGGFNNVFTERLSSLARLCRAPERNKANKRKWQGQVLKNLSQNRELHVAVRNHCA